VVFFIAAPPLRYLTVCDSQSEVYLASTVY
jgi:hypothetical protein